MTTTGTVSFLVAKVLKFEVKSNIVEILLLDNSKIHSTLLVTSIRAGSRTKLPNWA